MGSNSKMDTKAMGKTYHDKPIQKERHRDDRLGDHGVRQNQKNHEKTKEKKLLRHYEQHWQELEDGD